MPSLRYHSGRMVLLPKPTGWTVRLKTNNGTVEIDVEAVDLSAAVIQAEQLYADLCTLSSGLPTCFDCVHWHYVKGRCDVGIPEGRRTGGKHAKDCEAFWRKLEAKR